MSQLDPHTLQAFRQSSSLLAFKAADTNTKNTTQINMSDT